MKDLRFHPPPAPSGYSWRSAPECAKIFNRTLRGIRQWCQRGRFAALDVSIYQDVNKRWWILLRNDEETTNLGL